MRIIARALLRTIGISDSNAALRRYRRFKRALLGTDAKIKNAYLTTSICTKLHLGSSNHLLPGWLNTDLCAAEGVMALDATSSYPFPRDTFNFIFSEHMIEHVPYDSALRMLKECYRVLKPTGVIRIVTPDLTKILGLYPHPPNEQARVYLRWMSTTFTPEAEQNCATHVVNAFFRLWGHQFIYDQPTLETAMRSSGFINIIRRELGQSDHAELTNLENTTRYPDGLLNYESLCVEARKPPN